eukprot:gb/GECG01014623.1/.p1 GENE.gb/GECG01014623.1/~~gb/GECG01014623.1/.p1  ORF type:complete len:504 (+),score=48.51 gb/GECG01014623.1/:1-1512(+)
MACPDTQEESKASHTTPGMTTTGNTALVLGFVAFLGVVMILEQHLWDVPTRMASEERRDNASRGALLSYNTNSSFHGSGHQGNSTGGRPGTTKQGDRTVIGHWKQPQQPRTGKQTQIHLSLGETAEAPSLYITWSTSRPSNTSSVELWRANEREENAKIYHGRARDTVQVRNSYVHRVHVGHLEPNVPLCYSVVNDEEKSPATIIRVYEGHHFGLPMAVFGDLGLTNAVSLEPLKADAREGKFNLAVHAGDIAYTLNRGGDGFLKKIEPIASKFPYHVVPGNHDMGSSLKHLRDRFSMPHGGLPNGNQWHSFDFGGIHVTMISTEVWHKRRSANIDRQYRWIEADLHNASRPARRSKVPFIVVVGHRPMYCSAGHAECHNVRNPVRKGSHGIEHLLQRYNVDMYFAGHVHAYERSLPVYDDKFEQQTDHHHYVKPNSTVHITIGNAGSKYKTMTMKVKKPWTAQQVRGYGYGRLTAVSPNELLWEYVDGKSRTVADYVRIKKS